MRIALVNNFFRPRAGGSAHFTEETAKELTLRGHEVLVVTSSAGATAGEQVEDGYCVSRMPALTLPPLKIAFNYSLNVTLSPGNVRALFDRLDRFAPHVVHINNQIFDLSLQAEAWAARRRVPLVATIHTALVHSNPALAAVLASVDFGVVRPLFRLTRAQVVAPDKYMDRYVRRRYRTPEARIVHIPIGIDVTRFDAAEHPIDVRAHHQVGARPLVLSVGHVIPMIRDRLALIEALPRLRQLLPEVLVMVVGHVYDDRFLRRAQQLGVQDAVMCVGSVPKAHVPSYVAAADVEAHDLEGWGLGTASMEVMAAGVPVVASVDTDNFPGIEMRDRQDILLVPRGNPQVLAETMAELLSRPDFRREMGQNQAAFARKHFSIRAVTDQYEALYRRIS
jgi:glycosyltransferase involved in cell wall biosynthesis